MRLRASQQTGRTLLASGPGYKGSRLLLCCLPRSGACCGQHPIVPAADTHCPGAATSLLCMPSAPPRVHHTTYRSILKYLTREDFRVRHHRFMDLCVHRIEDARRRFGPQVFQHVVIVRVLHANLLPALPIVSSLATSRLIADRPPPLKPTDGLGRLKLQARSGCPSVVQAGIALYRPLSHWLNGTALAVLQYRQWRPLCCKLLVSTVVTCCQCFKQPPAMCNSSPFTSHSHCLNRLASFCGGQWRDFPLSHLALPCLRNVQTIEIDQTMYPEILGDLFIVNSPWVFQGLWPIMKV